MEWRIGSVRDLTVHDVISVGPYPMAQACKNVDNLVSHLAKLLGGHPRDCKALAGLEMGDLRGASAPPLVCLLLERFHSCTASVQISRGFHS